MFDNLNKRIEDVISIAKENYIYQTGSNMVKLPAFLIMIITQQSPIEFLFEIIGEVLEEIDAKIMNKEFSEIKVLYYKRIKESTIALMDEISSISEAIQEIIDGRS